jgi:hypothetical protein
LLCGAHIAYFFDQVALVSVGVGHAGGMASDTELSFENKNAVYSEISKLKTQERYEFSRQRLETANERSMW